MPRVKFTQGTVAQRADQEAFPYGLAVSVAVALDPGYQFPHCVVARSGTRLLRD